MECVAAVETEVAASSAQLTTLLRLNPPFKEPSRNPTDGDLVQDEEQIQDGASPSASVCSGQRTASFTGGNLQTAAPSASVSPSQSTGIRAKTAPSSSLNWSRRFYDLAHTLSGSSESSRSSDRTNSIRSSLKFFTPSSRTASSLSADDEVLELSMDAEGVFSSADGLFTARRRSFPVPIALRERWDTEIKTKLIQDISPVLRRLPRNLSRYQTSIELEFCMAGYQRPGSQIVCMLPSVWIKCGSKKCVKLMKQEVEHLAYLKTFSCGSVVVSQEAPRLAMQPTQTSALGGHTTSGAFSTFVVTEERPDVVFAHVNPQTRWTTCGIHLEVQGHGGQIDFVLSNRAVIGGLIEFQGSLYGLTTAHVFLEDRENNESTGTTESDDEDDEDNADDAISDAAGSTLTHTTQRTSQQQTHLDQHEADDRDICSEHPDRVSEGQPVVLKGWAFAHRASITGSFATTIRVSSYTDYALLDISRLFVRNNNSYMSSPHREIEITRIGEQAEPGEVQILIQPMTPMTGYLLDGTATMMDRYGVLSVRKIELGTSIPQGCSGAWVVRGDTLLGHIVAIDEQQPYTYMTPVDEVFAALNTIHQVTPLSSDAASLPQQGITLHNLARDHMSRSGMMKRLPNKLAYVEEDDPPIYENSSVFRLGASTFQSRNDQDSIHLQSHHAWDVTTRKGKEPLSWPRGSDAVYSPERLPTIDEQSASAHRTSTVPRTPVLPSNSHVVETPRRFRERLGTWSLWVLLYCLALTPSIPIVLKSGRQSPFSGISVMGIFVCVLFHDIYRHIRRRLRRGLRREPQSHTEPMVELGRYADNKEKNKPL